MFECGGNLNMSKQIDITGKTFGELTALKYLGNRVWECKCSCGKITHINSYALRKGLVKSCGHGIFKDLTGQKFGDWVVLGYAGSDKGNSLWKCRCSCGVEKIVYGNSLKSGRSKSCGHNTNVFKDLTGQKFGEWKVIKHKSGRMWECECSCGKIKDIDASSLIEGKSLSCGCKQKERQRATMLAKYNDTVATKSREKWQIEVIESKENMLNYISQKEKRMTAYEIAQELGINTNSVYRIIHKYNLESHIDINYNSSKYELEICSILDSLNIQYNKRDRYEVEGLEIDIYIPSRKIGIEFNGSYWHSEIFKNKMYHQNKTIQCARSGIRLIHIFEYEWIDKDSREKITKYLINLLSNNIKIYARNTRVGDITKLETNLFLEEYHMQGSANSSIDIGLYNECNELLGVMTFGKPRFDRDAEFELVRLCWKSGITVVGGANKLFNYFVNKYKPNSVVTYSDVSKFTGNIYTLLGFKPESKLTEPSYCWYNLNTKQVLTRYQTMKHKLIESGIGTEEETESEIMERHDFVRIYNCGNIKFNWRK